MECYACRHEERFDELPPRERVAADASWRVAHAFNSVLPGWLVLLPRRHVASIAELTPAEATTLGTWQVRLSQALEVVTGCVKTYVMQFSEQEGFAHLHFHIVPRAAELPAQHRGPRVFHYLTTGDPLREDRRDEIALAVRSALT